MKFLLPVIAILVSISAFAKEEIVTRTALTGKDQVISVGSCSWPITYKDISGQERIKSEFTYTVCRESVTYKATRVSADEWYNWSATETPIDGTATNSYELDTATSVSDQPVNPNDPFQTLTVTRACENSREGYQMARVPLAKSNCTR